MIKRPKIWLLPDEKKELPGIELVHKDEINERVFNTGPLEFANVMAHLDETESFPEKDTDDLEYVALTANHPLYKPIENNPNG
jgi:hypothetical protein